MSQDENIRLEAILLLSNVLQSCENISENTVSELVAFYCDRLPDNASVPNLVIGLDALASRLNQHNATVLSSTLFSHVDIQSFPHVTRNVIFHILNRILEYHYPLDSGVFITGIIRAMEGEKDPRNLMTAYDIILNIIKSQSISDEQIEPLFNATFCYFPITFRPPPDNPYGITAKHLKLKLRECMSSTPLFAPYALPLLQKKIGSTSGSAKKDTLETITACLPVYGPDNLALYASSLFDSVKMEIINGDPDPGLRDPCLDTIHALAICISQYEDSKRAIQLLKPVLDDCVILLEDFDEDSTKPASLILRSVASASSFSYSLVENIILPILLRQYRETTAEMEYYLIICTMVALIQARKMVFGVISSGDEEVKGYDKAYSQSIILTLLHIIQTKDVQKHDDIKQYIKSIGFRLIKLVILENISATVTANAIISSDAILNVICRILLILFKNLDAVDQKKVLSTVYQLFKNGDVSILDISNPTTAQFCPLVAPNNQQASTLLFSVFISTLRKTVKLEDEEFVFLDEMIHQALRSTHPLQLASFCRCIASVINKWKDDTALINYVESCKTKLNNQITELKSHQALTIYLWITKALIIRSHKKSQEMMDRVVSLIDHEDLGKEAAIGFDILIGDDDLGLNKDCFATVSILYKQKFMSYSLPKLLDKFNNNKENKANYLIAIAYLLKNEPKSILINELPSLVPLLIESISLPEIVVKLSTLDLFEFALYEGIMPETYLVTLLPTLTTLTKEPSMKVRIASLKCLTLIPSRFPKDTVASFQKEVIKRLSVVRDDKKRLVRKQAVECLESWYLVN
ncbi:hypothetical protein K501DRAFT_285853 [Backusella circina FSU 941]|nr:hypothetical protein K501DRAFT_285853 [Backusella circina FSU 941]